jgi:penicillin amidase
VSSANQSLTDKTYPYYINWQFGPYQRGTRINTRLAAMDKITVDSMRLLQTDNYSITARDILPTLMAQIDSSKLDNNQLKALDILRRWDKRYDATSVGASIFDAWWRKVYTLTWKDEFGDDKANLQWPSRDRTIKMLLTQPRAKWFDDVNTPGVETAEDIVSAAFNQSVNELSVKHGRPGPGWHWGKVRPTSIDHLAALKGFGTGNFESGGSSNLVNAIHEGAGPSWRMVVQMGPTVKGYGVFPGGESGNPGSFYYTDMLQTWKDGQLNELLYLRSANEKSDRIKSVTLLKKSIK